MRLKLICLYCKKEFEVPFFQRKRKYCGQSCKALAYKNGFRPVTWGEKISKSKMGHGWPEGYHERQSIAQKIRFLTDSPKNKGKKMPEISGENNYLWKGDKVGIKALHAWVKRHRGRPNHCDKCHSSDRKYYDWANISHKYKRDLNDFMQLCRSCHRIYDAEYRKRLGIKLIYKTRKDKGHYKKL